MSTSAPTTGDSTIPGNTVKRITIENFVTEPVVWYTQTLMAKPVRLEPMIEITCPIQITIKVDIPRSAVVSVMALL
jgi:hypothetical protein